MPFVVSRVQRGGRAFELEGLNARLDVVGDPVVRAGPALGFNLPRTDDADSDVVALLPERNVAVHAGLFGGFALPVDGLREGSLAGTLTVLGDVSGVHDGATATADVELFFAASYMLRFGIGLNATLASDEYMASYFSVSGPDAAATGLSRFDASAGRKDVGAEVYSTLSFSESLEIFSRVAYTRLLGDAADSPIVAIEGNDEQLFFGAGNFWRF